MQIIGKGLYFWRIFKIFGVCLLDSSETLLLLLSNNDLCSLLNVLVLLPSEVLFFIFRVCLGSGAFFDVFLFSKIQVIEKWFFFLQRNLKI